MTILFIWKERCKTPRLPIGKGNTQCKLAEQEGAKGTCNSDSHKQDYSICIIGNHYKPLFVTRILYGDISNLPRVHHSIVWCKKTNTKWLRTTISVTCWIILSSPPASLRPKFLEKIVTTAIVCLLAGLMFHFDLAGVHWTRHKGTKGFQIMTGFWLERPVWYMVMFQDKVVLLNFGLWIPWKKLFAILPETNS